MNTTILKKCLAELQSATPRLEYIEGMLETLIEMNTAGSSNGRTEDLGPSDVGSIPTPATRNIPQDEAAMLEARARAAVQTIKALSESSSHE